jgi:hypothetical protein
MVSTTSLYKFMTACLIGCTLFSCKKMLELNPKQSIDAGIALNTEQGVNAATTGIYARLQSVNQYGRNYYAIAEALADNVYHSGNSSQLANECSNAPGAHFTNWQSCYYAINQSNLVLDALKILPASQQYKDGIAAQVYFLRALFYHDLARTMAYDPTAIYAPANKGGVPIVTNGVNDIDEISFEERASIPAVYERIYDDLDSSYACFNRNNAQTSVHKASKAAVVALYTRVALYNGDYQTALDKATESLTLSGSKFQTNGNYINAWRAEAHPESIFEVKFNVNENLGSDNSLRGMFTTRAFLTDVTASIHGVIVVKPSFYDLMPAGDVRKGLYMNGLGANVARLECTKYISKNKVANLDNVPVIRVSEVYLNRAEAAYKTGTPAGEAQALADLNTIRERAGLTAVNLSGQALLDEILLQRRLELAFEGHRFFDLKRNGMDIIKETGNILFTDYRMLPRIPIREVNANSKLEQNEGYK